MKSIQELGISPAPWKNEREFMADVCLCFEALNAHNYDMAGAYCSETCGDEGQGTEHFLGSYRDLDGTLHEDGEFHKYCEGLVSKMKALFGREIEKKMKARNQKDWEEDDRKMRKEIGASANSCCLDCKNWDGKHKICPHCYHYENGEKVFLKIAKPNKYICYGWNK